VQGIAPIENYGAGPKSIIGQLVLTCLWQFVFPLFSCLASDTIYELLEVKSPVFG